MSARLIAFERSVQVAVGAFDQLVPLGVKPAGAAELEAVVTLCAGLHGE